MKLTQSELAQLDALIAAMPAQQRRDRPCESTEPGEPGGRDKPLSYAALLKLRQSKLAASDD